MNVMIFSHTPNTARSLTFETFSCKTMHFRTLFSVFQTNVQRFALFRTRKKINKYLSKCFVSTEAKRHFATHSDLSVEITVHERFLKS